MMKKSTQILTVIKKTKEGFLCICLSVILTVSVYRTGKSYYTQVLLEECKYVVQERKCPSILLTVQKFPLMILMKKILMKKLLMKKIKYWKNYSRICLAFIFLMSQMIHPYTLWKEIYYIFFKVIHVIVNDFKSF